MAFWRATMSTRWSSPRRTTSTSRNSGRGPHPPLPVLVEKPIATRPEDDAALRDLARDYPAPIWVAMEYRYMPPIARFRELAEEATGGIKMLTIREHRFPFLEKVGDWNRFNRNTGGTLVEKCCHFFDLMRLILQRRTRARHGQRGTGREPPRRDATRARPRTSGTTAMSSSISPAARARCWSCACSPKAPTTRRSCRRRPHRQDPGLRARPHPLLELRYRAAARAAPDRQPAPPHRAGQRVDIPVDPQLLEAGDHNGATYYQHRRFLDAVRTGRTPEVTLEDGAMAVRMGLAAQEAARTGQGRVSLSMVPRIDIGIDGGGTGCRVAISVEGGDPTETRWRGQCRDRPGRGRGRDPRGALGRSSPATASPSTTWRPPASAQGWRARACPASPTPSPRACPSSPTWSMTASRRWRARLAARTEPWSASAPAPSSSEITRRHPPYRRLGLPTGRRRLRRLARTPRPVAQPPRRRWPPAPRPAGRGADGGHAAAPRSLRPRRHPRRFRPTGSSRARSTPTPPSPNA
jgi:myo-inositol 2-dehydrogenase/D-chiro-inositol 1-dehydrogenase